MTDLQPCFACGQVRVTITSRWQECAACGFHWQPLYGHRATAENPPSRTVWRQLPIKNAWKLTGRARTPLQDRLVRRFGVLPSR